MRSINLIVVHCSATRADRALTTEELETIHRRRGFRGIGYHYYIRRDGTVVNTRPPELIGAHVKGHTSATVTSADTAISARTWTGTGWWNRRNG